MLIDFQIVLVLCKAMVVKLNFVHKAEGLPKSVLLKWYVCQIHIPPIYIPIQSIFILHSSRLTNMTYRYLFWLWMLSFPFQMLSLNQIPLPIPVEHKKFAEFRIQMRMLVSNSIRYLENQEAKLHHIIKNYASGIIRDFLKEKEAKRDYRYHRQLENLIDHDFYHYPTIQRFGTIYGSSNFSRNDQLENAILEVKEPDWSIIRSRIQNTFDNIHRSMERNSDLYFQSIFGSRSGPMYPVFQELANGTWSPCVNESTPILFDLLSYLDNFVDSFIFAVNRARS